MHIRRYYLCIALSLLGRRHSYRTKRTQGYSFYSGKCRTFVKKKIYFNFRREFFDFLNSFLPSPNLFLDPKLKKKNRQLCLYVNQLKYKKRRKKIT